jgi:hypothetical protein
MKARDGVLMLALVAFTLIFSQKARAGNGNGGQGIPIRGGQFSETAQGSFAVCLNPTTFAEESCATSGALVAPLTILDYGAITGDTSGNSCSTLTEVDTDFPPDASPPTVTADEHTASKVLNYDPTSGTGDTSFTSYTGGSCNGAIFNNGGATELSSGTAHFVVSRDGNRVDFIITKLTNSTSSIGDFGIFGTELNQSK